MDKFDIAILELMQGDASSSVAEIAEQVALSKTACWRRMQKLQKAGVIRAQVTLLDQEKVNLPMTAYILVRTNQHNKTWYSQFRDVVNAIPEVLEVYRMSGDVDYLIKAAVTSMPGYDKLYKQLVKAELFDVSSSFVMETLKHTTELPLHHINK